MEAMEQKEVEYLAHIKKEIEATTSAHALELEQVAQAHALQLQTAKEEIEQAKRETASATSDFDAARKEIEHISGEIVKLQDELGSKGALLGEAQTNISALVAEAKTCEQNHKVEIETLKQAVEYALREAFKSDFDRAKQ